MEGMYFVASGGGGSRGGEEMGRCRPIYNGRLACRMMGRSLGMQAAKGIKR
jgi:hypothetical protein